MATIAFVEIDGKGLQLAGNNCSHDRGAQSKVAQSTLGLQYGLKEEEQLRNSVMFDLLYVHPHHALAAQITLYYRLCDIEKLPWTVDTIASGGMNGFLWLTKRNGLKQVIPSPVNGLEDITNNQVLNITYLNPAPHAHIPKPPEGVNMPDKILRPIDVKPFPILWHEDNSGRHQQGKERPHVSGAISGPILGEAAYRLVHNALNIKSERTNSRNFQGNHVISRMRPAGPPGYERGVSESQSCSNHHAPYRLREAGQSGYERGAGRYGYNEQGYSDDPNFLNGHYIPYAPMGSANYGISLNDMQSNRQTFNTQDKYSYQEQHHDLRNSMSALTVEGGFKTRPLAAMSSRSSNSGQVSYVRPHLAQYTGPLPSPPPKWISRRAGGSTVMYPRQQQTSVATGLERPVKMVYQVKNKAAQNLVDSELQQ